MIHVHYWITQGFVFGVENEALPDVAFHEGPASENVMLRIQSSVIFYKHEFVGAADADAQELERKHTEMRGYLDGERVAAQTEIETAANFKFDSSFS